MLSSEDLFDLNLEFFKKINPTLAERMAAHKPISTVVFDDDGEPDVLFQGMKLYGKGAQKHASAQREAFWKAPGVGTLGAQTLLSMDSEAEKLRLNCLKFAEDNGITFNEQRTTRKAFHLVVLGIGLGQHIAPLLDDVCPRNLILVEPNFEFLYHSLSFLDWQGTVGALMEDGGEIHILTDNNPTYLISEVRRTYTIYGRANFDGITVYRHYENPAFIAVEQFIATEGGALFSGLGFFEDEINMIANTYNNLKSGEERVFYADEDQKVMPVFVIGSGPSLDGSLDIIQANADKAIIISCGTGLLPLLRAGIKPDFHVELERSKAQMEIPQAVSQEYDLSDIYLVGSTTLVPGVRNVFEKRIFYFRHMLSSYPAFSGQIRNCLRYPSPTVGNTGVSFAQDTGFRNFYLFGMDLGFVDPYAHHSTSSIYRTDFGDKKKYDLGEAHWDSRVPGNFGGSVMTTNVHKWSRDMYEVAIDNSCMGYTYYNCSDGALIRGTIPLLPEFVDLPEPAQPKKRLVEDIVESMPIYTKESFEAHWQKGKIAKEVRDVGDRLIACIRDYPDLETKKYISKLMKVANPVAFDDAPVLILRGSMLLCLVVGEYLLDRIEQTDKKDMMMAFICDEYCRTIDSLCDEVKVEFSSLETTGMLVNRETIW